jgi:hypothetical protein
MALPDVAEPLFDCPEQPAKTANAKTETITNFACIILSLSIFYFLDIAGLF